MKYLLGIPYVNRPDLLRLAVNSVQCMWPHTFILDNSPNGEIQRAKADWPVAVRRATAGLTLSFSESMNVIATAAQTAGCDAYFFMHNDAEADPGTAEKLLKFVEAALISKRKWGVVFTHYDTLAALNVEAVAEIGPWDGTLSQYYADNDYYRRLRLAGYEPIEAGLPVKHHNGASSTFKSDPKRELLNRVTFPLYGAYYRAKWGGDPPHERFQRPFDSQLF